MRSAWWDLQVAPAAAADAAQRLLALAGRCEAIAWQAEFGFLYHPKRHLLHIGYRVAEQQLDAGFYDLLFIGIDKNGRQVRGSVYGDKDPGYGSTSKIIAETAVCLVKEGADAPAGVSVPGAALGQKLVDRLAKNAGLTFKDETA